MTGRGSFGGTSNRQAAGSRQAARFPRDWLMLMVDDDDASLSLMLSLLLRMSRAHPN